MKKDGENRLDKIEKNIDDIPGGHSFDRIDREQAKEIRLKIYDHLAKQLKPPKQLKTLEDIMNAAYLK